MATSALDTLKRAPATDGDPERSLMVAILADALTQIANVKPSNARRAQDRYKVWKVRREAVQWLRAQDRQWIYGFGSICDALDMDDRAILKAVEAETDLDAIARARPGDRDAAAPRRPSRRPARRGRPSR